MNKLFFGNKIDIGEFKVFELIEKFDHALVLHFFINAKFDGSDFITHF